LADKTLFFCGFMGKNSLDIVLQQLMATAHITNWQQLSQQTGISIKRLRKLRQGQSDHLKLSELIQLSRSFQISLVVLLEQLNVPDLDLSNEQTTASLPKFQFDSIQAIESFLTYWPAAAHQVQLNPNFLASKLLPLVKPIDRLLASWNVVQLDAVGAIVNFNPQQHQAIAAGVNGTIDRPIQPTELVTVRYPGYHQSNKLLWRSQVSRT
jgi:DNA-binding Xre family transcriptional regulator